MVTASNSDLSKPVEVQENVR